MKKIILAPSLLIIILSLALSACSNNSDEASSAISLTLTGELGSEDLINIKSHHSLKSLDMSKASLKQGITSIPASCSQELYSLENIKFPQGIEIIEGNAFGNAAFKKLDLPVGLEKISSGAFRNCVDLSYLAMPSTLQSISNMAFQNCVGIAEIHIYKNTPPVLEENAFAYNVLNTTPLYVPKGSKKAYKNAPEWNAFKIIIEE